MGRVAEIFRERRRGIVEDIRQEFAVPTPGVASALCDGLREFSRRLDASYTTVSRRYSLWRLLEEHIDVPWAGVSPPPRVLATAVHPSLFDMKASKCGKVLPDGGRVDANSANEVVRCISSWHVLLVAARDSAEELLSGSDGRRGLDRWLEKEATPRARTAEASSVERWLGSLNAMIFLFRNLIELRGADDSNGYEWSAVVRQKILRVEIEAGLRQELVSEEVLARRTGLSLATIAEENRSRLFHAATLRTTNQYCTICWRETTKYEYYKRLVFGPLDGLRSSVSLSSKYCWLHVPSNDRTRYWADRKRADGIRKLRWRLYERSRCGFVDRLLPTKGVDRQEAAKIAYDIHRNDLRGGVVPVRSPKLRDRVAALMGRGLTQSQIADQLGVSRQAVSKVVKRLREIWAAKAREIENIDPTTNEIMEWNTLAPKVKEMSAKGFAAADIAKEFGLYRHTIDAMLRWSKEQAD